MEEYGGPEVLKQISRDDAEPGAAEVIVRTIAAGVNRADLFIRSGAWRINGPLPYVPGLEVAGIVDRVGPKVRAFEPGQHVITMMQRLGGIHGTRAGGYQSHVVVPAETLVPIPKELDVVDA